MVLVKKNIFYFVLLCSLVAPSVVTAKETKEKDHTADTIQESRREDNEDVKNRIHITQASLAGEWSGKWKAKGSSGGIKVIFNMQGVASYIVKDGSEEYRWGARVEIGIEGEKVTTNPGNRVREDTYELFQNKDGSLMLIGSYTYEGKKWGTVTLRKVTPKA